MEENANDFVNYMLLLSSFPGQRVQWKYIAELAASRGG
jgi:hypothetical protein